MDTAQALQSRIRTAGANDTIAGLFLESSLQLLHESLGGVATAHLRSHVLGKRSLLSFLRYPAEDLLWLVSLGVAVAGAEAFHEHLVCFGRAAVQRFFDIPVGMVMAEQGRDDAHQLLTSAPARYRAVVSFGERSYERLGERSGVMHFQGDLLGPAWHQGVLEEALSLSTGRMPRVRAERCSASGLDFSLRAEW